MMASSRVFTYLPLVLLLFARSLHCTCAEEHVVAEGTKKGVPAGIDTRAKQAPDSPTSAPAQRLPSANLLIPSSELVQEQTLQQQQVKKSDQKEQTANVTSHVTPTGVISEGHARQLDEGSRLPAPTGGQQLPGDRPRLGIEDLATGTVMLIEDNGDISALSPHPGSGRPTRPRPQLLPPTPDDRPNLSSSLSRTPKELQIVSSDELLTTPLIHHGGADVLPVGHPPLVADISNANSWVLTDTEKTGGISLNIADDADVKVNTTSGFRQPGGIVAPPYLLNGGDRQPGGIISPPSSSNDPSQNYSGSILFQPTVFLPPQQQSTSNGDKNSTMSDDEESSDSPIEASPTKNRQQNMRRRGRKSQSVSHRQRSLSLSASAENSTTSGSTSGVETTTQGVRSAANGNQITGNRRPDDNFAVDNMPTPQTGLNGPHDVHALGQWPSFGNPMDNHGPELPIGNGAGLDQWLQSHPPGGHPQFSPVFPPNWPHQQPGLDVAFFPVNENETTANGTHPTGTDNIFPMFLAPIGQHHPAELPPPERFSDQFLAPAGGLIGNSPYDSHSPRENHPAVQQSLHPGPLDFVVPSFINPVDRPSAPVGPSTPTSSLTGTVHLGYSIQSTDDSSASATGSSSPSSTIPSKNNSAAGTSRSTGDSSTPLTTASQSSSSTRSGSVTTASTPTITLSSATTSGGVTVWNSTSQSASSTQLNNASSSSSTANVASRLPSGATTSVTKRQHVSATDDQTTHVSPDVGVRPTEDQQSRHLHQRSTGTRPTSGSSIGITLLLLLTFYLSINGGMGHHYHL